MRIVILEVDEKIVILEGELLENYSFSDNTFENYLILFNCVNYSFLINFDNHFSHQLQEFLEIQKALENPVVLTSESHL